MEATMRAGYDTVSLDTRRPPIPDLPLADAQEGDQLAKDGTRGMIALASFVAFMLAFAIGLGLYAEKTMRLTASTHVTATQ
jgi:hypothetical protein